jgi:hypothetical protein
MPLELEPRIIEQSVYVPPRPSIEIVYAEDFGAVRKQLLTEVRTDEPGPASDENTLSVQGFIAQPNPLSLVADKI